jgi:FdhD protein
MGSRQPVSGAVLAGGRSRRMGQDKRWLPIDGVPLLARAVAAVAAVADEVLVVTAAPADAAAVAAALDDLPPGTARWQGDQRPGQGPLAGIEAALAEASHDVVLVLAGDHPEAMPAVLRALLDLLHTHPEADAAVLASDRGPQPLVAAYRRAALPAIRALLDAGERRATRIVDHLDTVVLEHSAWQRLDPTGATVRDLDTPEDLQAMRALAGTTPAGDLMTQAGTAPSGRRTAPVTATAVRQADRTRRRDEVVIEEPLEIRACGPGQEPVVVATTLRTPGHDVELAAGWLFAEGLLGPGDLVASRVGDPVALARPDDQLTLHLRRPLDLDAVAHRHAVATASCGVCGRATIDELASRCAPVPLDVPPAPVAWSALATLPDRIRAAQPVFAATGGLHAAAVATVEGELVTLREDVGRHNALDAAIGVHVLAGEVPLHGHVGLLSGRAGFELVAKAAAAGLPVLAAVGAPTDLAVRTADRLGVTLVGFLRDGEGNVYTHPERLDLHR